VHFLKQLHTEVRQTERKYERIEEVEEIDEEGEKNKEQKKEGDEKKEKDYFGQFKTSGRERISQKFVIEDTFESKIKASDLLANSIIDYYSYVDN
jgi:hypothetical protein